MWSCSWSKLTSHGLSRKLLKRWNVKGKHLCISQKKIIINPSQFAGHRFRPRRAIQLSIKDGPGRRPLLDIGLPKEDTINGLEPPPSPDFLRPLQCHRSIGYWPVYSCLPLEKLYSSATVGSACHNMSFSLPLILQKEEFDSHIALNYFI